MSFKNPWCHPLWQLCRLNHAASGRDIQHCGPFLVTRWFYFPFAPPHLRLRDRWQSTALNCTWPSDSGRPCLAEKLNIKGTFKYTTANTTWCLFFFFGREGKNSKEKNISVLFMKAWQFSSRDLSTFCTLGEKWWDVVQDWSYEPEKYGIRGWAEAAKVVPPAAAPLISALRYVAVRMTLILAEYKQITFTEQLCFSYWGIFIQEVPCTFSPVSQGSKLVLIAEVCSKSSAQSSAAFEDLFYSFRFFSECLKLRAEEHERKCRFYRPIKLPYSR